MQGRVKSRLNEQRGLKIEQTVRENDTAVLYQYNMVCFGTVVALKR